MAETSDARALLRQAAAVLDQALARRSTLHVPGMRDRHRAEIAQAIELAQRALAVVDADRAGGTVATARATLVKAYAARARDARHGVGQLSLGAQRAPTRDDCDDGWRRVEDIVGVAEAAAAEAARLALLLDDPAASDLARAADAAAQDARRIVRERNHAYTFHADPGFSFGEGWYLAAAAVLTGVAIQIEPDKPQTSQAQRFVRDAGLDPLVQPYRSRPRANKHLPDIVAAAFRADPNAAQRRLRAAFLGDEPIARAVVEWADGKLAGAAAGKTVLLWVRRGTHHPGRNTTHAELVELAGRARDAGLVPVLVGDALPNAEPPAGTVDCTLFWKDPLFQGPDMRRAQLQLFEHLRRAHGLVGQLGVTTAGMDGPALMGLPTMYLTDAPNVRLGAWVGAVPGYLEIVRGDGHLDTVSRTLRRWAAGETSDPA
ncbi:MAG TPA: hypothetical protein VN962_12780 [Polyangia bacterium]|nr:hypothetical protein [Polyangia bacterium]